MAKYINKEELLNEVNESISNAQYDFPYQNNTVIFLEGMRRVRDMIEDALDEDVQKVEHGRWIKYDDNIYECSECGYDWYLTNLASHPKDNNAFYCPECGAEMDLEV